MQNEIADGVEIWQLLRKYRRFIFLWGVAGFVVTALFTLTLHNVFTADSSFVLPKSATSNASLLNQQLQSFSVGFGTKSSGDMYVSIMRSRRVVDGLIEHNNLMSVFHAKKLSQAEAAVMSSTKFDSGEKDNIFRIFVTSRDPKLAMTLANGYIHELSLANGELALTEAAQRRAFFEKQMSDEKTALENADVDLKRTQEKSGFVAPGPQTAMQLQSVDTLRQAIQLRESQLAGILKGATEQDPTVIRLRTEIGSLRGELSAMQKGNSENSGTISTAQVPQAQLDYIHAQREVAFHQALFEIFSKQYEAARLDEDDAPVLQVLDVAITPDTKSGPRRSLITLCGMFLALIGSSLWVLLRKSKTSVRLSV